MLKYLDFKDARCKDCYKCLRECPVKAIEVSGHQARIIEKRCILCGKCTQVCPQNAKVVHNEIDFVEKLLKSDSPVIASVAPSFASSFSLQNFAVINSALKRLGFSEAAETAVGAKIVTEEYIKLLNSGRFKNFITSACPSVNSMIKLYHPKALEFLAPVDSPMTAHAKIIKKNNPSAKIVFIGPCVSKKREAYDGGLIEAVLTFEELNELFKKRNITLNGCKAEDSANGGNKARYYPISRGIIKSFAAYPDNYEYVAVDGVQKCNEVLLNIECFSGLFLELNACEYACVNGPCSLKNKGGSVKANEEIRTFALRGRDFSAPAPNTEGLDFTCTHKRSRPAEYTPTESEITEILKSTGKFTREDELNCGACGYGTCREKAWAVANNYAEKDMCMPYMRERAESMSYEIIQNSPNGIVLLDSEFKIAEINGKAKELWGVSNGDIRGRDLFDFFNPTDFVLAANDGKNVYGKKIFIEKTGKYIELTIILLKVHNVLFGVMKDISTQEISEKKLKALKLETLSTTDNVIKKQMRVAQEIASLLGETTAETKVAILKLKQTLLENNGE